MGVVLGVGGRTGHFQTARRLMPGDRRQVTPTASTAGEHGGQLFCPNWLLSNAAAAPSPDRLFTAVPPPAEKPEMCPLCPVRNVACGPLRLSVRQNAGGVLDEGCAPFGGFLVAFVGSCPRLFSGRHVGAGLSRHRAKFRLQATLDRRAGLGEAGQKAVERRGQEEREDP